jgi:DNA-binding response OmpR family regulator
MKENKIWRAGESVGAPLQCQKSLSRRILVVDDDIFIRQLNTQVLIRSGYEVDAAEDGAVAWDALQLNSYDLLITDNNMPKVSGIELLKKLHAARMALPVIMATGALPEEFTGYPWLQPAATLLKPYTVAEFLGAVKEVLRATGVVGEEIVPLPVWPSQPLALVCGHDDSTPQFSLPLTVCC